MASGVFESFPGYSSFLSNSLESLRGVIDSLVATPESDLNVQCLLEKLDEIHNNWMSDMRFASLVHFPSGIFFSHFVS